MTTYIGLPPPVGTDALHDPFDEKVSFIAGEPPAWSNDQLPLVPPPASTVAREVEYLIEYGIQAIDYLYTL